MACFKPNTVWYSKELTSTGKRKVVFNPSQALDPDAPFEIACRQCVGCRLKRSRDRALRCQHEASLYTHNCFITLTFNDESLYKRDDPYTLDVRDIQLFMKRLRKRYDGITEIHGKYPIRQYHCGEYGDKNMRPHYHLCIFNWVPPDLQFWSQSKTGQKYYVSNILSGEDNPHALWPHGYAVVGDLTFDSAAYVARYIMKKQTGANAFLRYTRIDHETGEILGYLKPEYNTGSTKPGIGKWWYDKYGNTDAHAHDHCVLKDHKVAVPEYYDRLLERFNPFHYEEIKEKRLLNALQSGYDTSRKALDRRNGYYETIVSKNLPRTLDGAL